MCSDSSSPPRQITGGAIATLHPRLDTSSSSSSTSRLPPPDTLQLHLCNDTSSVQPRTIATLISPTFARAKGADGMSLLGKWKVVIQRDGDLTSPSSASAPLHTFHFPSSFSATIHSTSGNGDRSPSIELDALDLSVGGQGLIGRKVQLVEFDDGGVGGEGERGRVVREGVLGWN